MFKKCSKINFNFSVMLFLVWSNCVYSNDNIFSIGLSGGSLSARYGLNTEQQLVITGRYNYFESEYTTENERYNPSTFQEEKTTTYSTNRRASLDLKFGFRQYLENSKYSYFVQPELGLRINHSNRNYYNDFDVDKLDNKENSYTFGLLGANGFGIEWKINDKISVEGIYFIQVQYNWLDLGGNRTEVTKSLYDYTKASINYWW